MMSVKYYNENSESFFYETLKADMTYMYQKFLENLTKKSGKILDLGCGSGRDSKYFKSLGFQVISIDASEELAKKASKYIEQDVIIGDMRDIEYEDEFIGVWACASILHLEIKDIEIVFRKIFKSLEKGGIFYASFKYGDENYIKNGRKFINFTEEKFFNLFPQYRENCIEIFKTFDVREGRESESWFNIILKK